MSPIIDKYQYARRRARELFLGITDEELERVAYVFSKQFDGNLSPRAEEHETPRAAGTGTDALTYLAWLLNSQ